VFTPLLQFLQQGNLIHRRDTAKVYAKNLTTVNEKELTGSGHFTAFWLLCSE